MKAPPFVYHRPETIDEALALLAGHGDEAKVLAGGQSLIPLMALPWIHRVGTRLAGARPPKRPLVLG